MDAEGGDKNVLNGINFKEYKFKFFLIETGKFKKIKKLLKISIYLFKNYIKKVFIVIIYLNTKIKLIIKNS